MSAAKWRRAMNSSSAAAAEAARGVRDTRRPAVVHSAAQPLPGRDVAMEARFSNWWRSVVRAVKWRHIAVLVFVIGLFFNSFAACLSPQTAEPFTRARCRFKITLDAFSAFFLREFGFFSFNALHDHIGRRGKLSLPHTP